MMRFIPKNRLGKHIIQPPTNLSAEEMERLRDDFEKAMASPSKYIALEAGFRIYEFSAGSAPKKKNLRKRKVSSCIKN